MADGPGVPVAPVSPLHAGSTGKRKPTVHQFRIRFRITIPQRQTLTIAHRRVAATVTHWIRSRAAAPPRASSSVARRRHDVANRGGLGGVPVWGWGLDSPRLFRCTARTSSFAPFANALSRTSSATRAGQARRTSAAEAWVAAGERVSWDRDSGELKQTKTGNKGIRRFAIEPTLMPLLRAMHTEANGVGPVVTMRDQKSRGGHRRHPG